MNERYSIVKIPPKFKQCAWNLYQKIGDKGQGFYFGKELVPQCVVKYLDEFVYSDNGEKIFNEYMKYHRAQCLESVEKYKEQISSKGYCGCLIKEYKSQGIELSTILNTPFFRSEQFKKIRTNCINKNRISGSK